jgi:hypothetical protein
MSRELGDGALHMCYGGLRVSRLLNPKEGYGPKKLKSMVLKGAEKVKKFKQMKISLTKG